MASETVVPNTDDTHVATMAVAAHFADLSFELWQDIEAVNTRERHSDFRQRWLNDFKKAFAAVNEAMAG